MGLDLLVALTVFAIPPRAPQAADTSAFATAAVRRIVERAMERQRAGDSAVTDYQALIRYRLSVGFGRRRWASIPASAVEEQAARVAWARPNELRVDVIGRRTRSRSEDLRLSSVFDRPWFVPRAVGDSVRIFSDEFPATGALHPLAPDGPRWYHYRQAGSVTVTSPGGAPVRLDKVEVIPRRKGPSLVAGRLWLDARTGDVVRFTFRYVGTALWVRARSPGEPAAPNTRDSASARRYNAIANRVVSIDADLEYALQNGRHWMPYRQMISGTVRIPIVSDVVIPFRAVTTFDEYTINTGRPIAFRVPLADPSPHARRARRDSLESERRGRSAARPDSLRAWDYADRWPGGRFEIHRPSNDSLARYSAWPDSLTLAIDPAEARRARDAEAELAELAERLPGDLTGRPGRGVAYERLTDLLQYNRVQGLSFGLGYRVRVPVVQFTALYGTVRYGLSDDRVTGRLTVLRDAPGGRLALSGYHDLADLDPVSPGRTVGNTLNGIFAGHDDGEYALASGGSASYETSLGPGLDLVGGVRLERQRSVGREARSAVNDFLGGSGLFPSNPSVDEATLGGASLRLVGFGRTRWSVTIDALGGGGRTTGRLYGQARRGIGGRRGATLRLKAGIATEPVLAQSLYRLGGSQTVRGFDYGTRRAPAFWAAQLDVTPLGGRVRPVLFIDAGQAARPGDLFGSQALVGAGVGLSLLRGLLRFDLSHPVTPDDGRKIRFDLVLQAVR